VPPGMHACLLVRLLYLWISHWRTLHQGNLARLDGGAWRRACPLLLRSSCRFAGRLWDYRYCACAPITPAMCALLPGGQALRRAAVVLSLPPLLRCA